MKIILALAVGFLVTNCSSAIVSNKDSKRNLAAADEDKPRCLDEQHWEINYSNLKNTDFIPAKEAIYFPEDTLIIGTKPRKVSFMEYRTHTHVNSAICDKLTSKTKGANPSEKVLLDSNKPRYIESITLASAEPNVKRSSHSKHTYIIHLTSDADVLSPAKSLYLECRLWTENKEMHDLAFLFRQLGKALARKQDHDNTQNPSICIPEPTRSNLDDQGTRTSA